MKPSNPHVPPGIALTALTLMIGSSAATASTLTLRPDLTELHREQLALIASPANASGNPMSDHPQRLARQQDIHHHNWLGGDNDVVTKARNTTLLAKASDPKELVFRV